MKQILVLAAITAVMAAVPATDVAAQKEKKQRTYALWGHVKDSFTKVGIPDVKITLMLSDSTVVDSSKVFYNPNTVTWNKDYMYRFIQPATPAEFIIKAEHPDYETTYVNYDVRHVKRNTYFDAPHHYMKRKEAHTNLDTYLDEVVIKASKVKLVHKQDTLVFDATAFSLPDGSMLDALIRQMPGVTLSDDGVITVNGRKVDYLLLNGKDFFKGDNKVMLDNLPYYTVKDIRVYDRQTDKSAYIGRDIEEQEYVMDINLKREYKKSYIANAEAGIATEERYLGRGAGIRLTENSAIMAYVNLNNINERRKPGSTGEWSPMNMPEGRHTTKDVGLNLTIDDKEKRFKENLTVSGNILDLARAQNSRTTNFSSAGTNLNIADSRSDSWERSFNLNNSFQLKVPFLLTAQTHIGMSDFSSWTESRSAYLNSGMDECDDNVEALDSIFSPTMNLDLRNRIVNRQSQAGRYQSDHLALSQNVLMNHKLPWGDNIEFEVKGQYNKFKNREFNDSRLDYFVSEQLADYRNRYNDSPSEQYNWEARAEYYFNFLSGWTWRLYTLFNQNNNKNDRNVYRLDQLDGWGNGIFPLGQYPADAALLDQALSADESVYANNLVRTSKSGVNAVYSRRTNTYSRYAQILLPFYVRNDKYHYARAGHDLRIDRNETYVDGSIVTNFVWGEWRRMLRANFWHTTELADIGDKVTLPDDRNPLAVRIGNPDLRNAHRFRSSVYYKYTMKNRRWSLYGQVDGLFKIDPIVQSFNYDPGTGVYTYRNVNGDKFVNSWLTAGFSGFLDKNQRWNVNYHGVLQRNWTETAEMNSDGTGSALYDLYMIHTSHDFSLRYSKGKFNSNIVGRITTHNMKYDTPQQTSYNTHSFDITHNVQYTIPVLEVQLASQLSWYHVNNDQEGVPNQTNVIWNVYASRSLLKDKSLLLKFSAFDILGDLSQQRFNVGDNSYGITSIQRLNQYFMLSLAWQFNKGMKKR